MQQWVQASEMKLVIQFVHDGLELGGVVRLYLKKGRSL